MRKFASDAFLNALGGGGNLTVATPSDDVLTRLEQREIDFDAAMKLLKR